MLNIFINIFFSLSMLIHIWDAKRMHATNRLPKRLDYAFSFLCGGVGALLFSTFVTTMSENRTEGIIDGIIGFVGMGVCIWTLTIYKRIRWENGR